jgi:hypothetical protein
MHFKKQKNIPENACPKKCPILHAELWTRQISKCLDVMKKKKTSPIFKQFVINLDQYTQKWKDKRQKQKQSYNERKKNSNKNNSLFKITCFKPGMFRLRFKTIGFLKCIEKELQIEINVKNVFLRCFHFFSVMWIFFYDRIIFTTWL